MNITLEPGMMLSMSGGCVMILGGSTAEGGERVWREGEQGEEGKWRRRGSGVKEKGVG